MLHRVQCQVGRSHNIVSDGGSHPSGQHWLVVPRPCELRPCELRPLFCATGPPRGGLFVRLHLCFRLGYALINIAPKLYDSWRHFFGPFDPRPPPATRCEAVNALEIRIVGCGRVVLIGRAQRQFCRFCGDEGKRNS